MSVAYGRRSHHHGRGTPCVAIKFVRQNKRLIAQLLNYSKGATAGRITLGTSPRLGHVKTARLLSQRQEELRLPVESLPNGSEIPVPALDMYDVAVLDLE